MVDANVLEPDDSLSLAEKVSDQLQSMVGKVVDSGVGPLQVPSSGRRID